MENSGKGRIGRSEEVAWSRGNSSGNDQESSKIGKNTSNHSSNKCYKPKAGEI